jgi:hypothetical protein
MHIVIGLLFLEFLLDGIKLTIPSEVPEFVLFSWCWLGKCQPSSLCLGEAAMKDMNAQQVQLISEVL